MLWKQQVSIFVVIIWADYVLCFYSEAFSSKAAYAITSRERQNSIPEASALANLLQVSSWQSWHALSLKETYNEPIVWLR